MSKNRRIGNSKCCKASYKSSRRTIYEMGILFCGVNQANIKIYKKQIYSCSHKLCYQMGGNKNIENNIIVVIIKFLQMFYSHLKHAYYRTLEQHAKQEGGMMIKEFISLMMPSSI